MWSSRVRVRVREIKMKILKEIKRDKEWKRDKEENEVKRRKWTKPCHCRYKPHTPCDMPLFVVYLYRVSVDNDQQWSCYLMISNRFVHVKWGKSDNFWLRKRKRNDSDHIHTLWERTDTERTEGEDGRTLSAWRRFAGRVSRLGSFI